MLLWPFATAYAQLSSQTLYPSSPESTLVSCVPRISGIWVAPEVRWRERPDVASAQWVKLASLPDTWQKRWPQGVSSAWYRLDWIASDCRFATPSHYLNGVLVVLINSMSLSGEIYSNEERLWPIQDEQSAPLFAWNHPLAIALPAKTAYKAGNAIWIRVEGITGLSPGLGNVELTTAAKAQKRLDRWQFYNRELVKMNMALSAMTGLFFFIIWVRHPRRTQDSAFGWFALSSLAWVLFVQQFVATSAWPFRTSLASFQWNYLWLLLYVGCFCLFCWRMGERHYPRLERLMWGVFTVFFLGIWLVPSLSSVWVMEVGKCVAILVFALNCLIFPFLLCKSKSWELRSLAICLWLFAALVIAQIISLYSALEVKTSILAVSSLVSIIAMSCIMAMRLASQAQASEKFAQTLAGTVDETRHTLTQSLREQYQLQLQNVRLQERLSLARDLHDGLGSTLVRSIASFEHTPDPTPQSHKALSVLRLLRNDLRQIVDAHADVYAEPASSPSEWLAHLRHRYTTVFDEINIRSTWYIDTQWPFALSSTQLLNLTRWLEEALANVIKHSRARHVGIACQAAPDRTLVLRVCDDGLGFDASDNAASASGIGMQSMHARAVKIGAQMQVRSRPGETVVEVRIHAAP